MTRSSKQPSKSNTTAAKTRAKPATRPAAARKTAAKPAASKATPKKAAKSAAKKPTKSKAPVRRQGARADLGAPIDGFFAKQPAQLRPILEALRKLIDEAAPDADSSLKWGMPFYSINGKMMCALGGHKSHVNLILSGPPGRYPDPEERLAGEGKTGRHLKLTTLDELPRAGVRGWLRTAAEIART